MITVFSPKSPDVQAFCVPTAVLVSVHGLNAQDTVTFKRIQFGAEQANFKRQQCCLFEPSPAQISSALDYKLGNCRPMLTANRNMLVIPFAGNYLPVIEADNSPDLTINVEPIEGSHFSDIEKGIVPCEVCFDEDWQTTGNQRCNQHFIEQEEVSNCGNLRWTRTAKRCGYYASVPIKINLEDECFEGFLFHPDETRDPDATVEIRDCNGKLYGYAYPTAGDGHTLPIEECDNPTPIGYAVNQSPTAPTRTEC